MYRWKDSSVIGPSGRVRLDWTALEWPQLRCLERGRGSGRQCCIVTGGRKGPRGSGLCYSLNKKVKQRPGPVARGSEDAFLQC